MSPEFAPTDAPTGTDAKIEAMAERFARGLPLWHRDDNPRCGRAILERGPGETAPVEAGYLRLALKLQASRGYGVSDNAA